MEILDKSTSDILAELSQLRLARGMSYQMVADACDVSQTTIIRVFKGEVEPSLSLIQKIAAAVQYKPESNKQPPADFSPEAYIAQLHDLLNQQQQEHSRHIQQLQCHYNMLRNQDRRTLVVMGGIIAILVIFICGVLIYDLAHLDRGWIQAACDALGILRT